MLCSGCNFDATKTNTGTQTQIQNHMGLYIQKNSPVHKSYTTTQLQRQIQNTVNGAPQYLFCEFVQYLWGVGL